MGSIKDEMRGLREDHQPCEKTDDGEHPGGSGGSTVPEGPQIDISPESTTQGDCQPKLLMNPSQTKEEGNNPVSKDPVFSGGDSDNTDSIQVKDHMQTDAISLTHQPESDKTATHNKPISNKSPSDGEGDADIQREESKDKRKDPETEEIENVLVHVPSTPDPLDPRSPAPLGQHHMRTQVSLEVVQCCSAATSPMTPPEGSHSFFFPNSFGRSVGMGTDTKDAELQVGQQVEFCTVATSPMTPKTPSTTAFPVLIGREKVQNEEKDLTQGLSANAPPDSSASHPSAGLIKSQVTLEDSNQQCKQQRMGSMDQDITILVTHYDNVEEEEEGKAELSFYSIEQEMVKIDEFEEDGESKSDRKERVSFEVTAPDQPQDTNPPQNKAEDTSAPDSDQPKTGIKPDASDVRGNKDACEELKDVSVMKAPVPESPAPFGCHNIRTQVSLEVVQCQSAATSPMTPPEGDQAFYFPSSFGQCVALGVQTKDAELQVGSQVEFRSVATAPMTPRTPTITTFPEIRKEASVEEKIVEEEEDKKEEDEENKQDVLKEEESVTLEETAEGAEEDKKEAIHSNEKGDEKCEEPVQEVSWDEKGMTWEVYGAVVEVAVLGSAIQKHLEKQVKKQKRQPSMPPPPPLNPSATPLTSESAQAGSGLGKVRAGKRGEQEVKVSRRRRNPFRLLMENVQQPHCCSRAHTTD